MSEEPIRLNVELPWRSLQCNFEIPLEAIGANVSNIPVRQRRIANFTTATLNSLNKAVNSTVKEKCIRVAVVKSRKRKRGPSSGETEDVRAIHMVGIYLQYEGDGSRIFFEVDRSACLGRALKLFAEQKDLPYEELSLYYSGARVGHDATPDSLDLEPASLFDVVLED